MGLLSFAMLIIDEQAMPLSFLRDILLISCLYCVCCYETCVLFAYQVISSYLLYPLTSHRNGQLGLMCMCGQLIERWSCAHAVVLVPLSCMLASVSSVSSFACWPLVCSINKIFSLSKYTSNCNHRAGLSIGKAPKMARGSCVIDARYALRHVYFKPHGTRCFRFES